MQTKKYLIGIITGTLITSMLYTVPNVKAIDFSKDEEKYMQLCSSDKLSNDNKSTCEDFNSYLKNKNKELLNQLSEQKEEASNTEDTLESVQKKLTEINTNISSKENEISYIETSISNTQTEIDKNSQEIKDRMYAMQSYMNDDLYINFIFGAENFIDLLSRIDSYNELTKSDQDLIEKLIVQMKEIEEQKETLETAKKALIVQKDQQSSLEKQYTALLEEQKKDILATQNAIYDYGAATESLSAAIDKFNAEAYETPVSNSKPVAPTTTTTNETTSNNNSNNTATNNNNSSTNNNETNNTDSTTDDSNTNNNNNNTSNNDNNNNNNDTNNDNNTANNNTSNNISGEVLGYNIYKIAYGKLGCLYYWGASGPDYFDCSGLVYYCLKKAGVSTYRTTASEYARKWTSVSWSNSRTGDLVCFGSPAYHIGIVVLNADGTRSVIHAGGGNSQTFGNNPNAKVKISSLEPGSYYYKNMTTIRRVS